MRPNFVPSSQKKRRMMAEPGLLSTTVVTLQPKIYFEGRVVILSAFLLLGNISAHKFCRD